MNAGFFLFEFGSTSLKFHFRDRQGGEVRSHKIPWEVAQEVYRTGLISASITERAACDITAILHRYAEGCDPSKILAFATGVFREADNILEFLFQVWRRTGLKVRVISGDQEAALLKAVFLRRRPPDRSFAFDLGSGSLQWVDVARERVKRGSIPFGVVTLLQRASDAQGNFIPGYGDFLTGKQLSGLEVVWPETVIGTGGTVKAIARALGGAAFDRESLAGFIDRVAKEGPPDHLKPHRRPLFLPGMVLVHRLMREVGAQTVRYQNLSVGEALLEKVLPFYSHRLLPHPTMVWEKIRFSDILPVTNGV